jgi:hypothetical protein
MNRIVIISFPIQLQSRIADPLVPL